MATRPPGPWGGQTTPAIGSGGGRPTTAPAPPSAVSKNSFSLFGAAEAALSRAATSVASAADSVAASLKVKAEELQKGIRNDLEGAYCIFVARIQAEYYVPEALLEETGCQLQALLSGIIPGLLEMLGVVGATTMLGAGVGGAIGFFAGGAGAIPGAVVGGELGFDIGMAALTWLGLGFLAVAIVEGFVELYETLHDGVMWAWQAKDLKGAAQKEQIDKAAHKMAKAVGILMRLVLQGILAYVLKKAAMGATRGALATGRSFATQGASATADASVAELAGRLRASRFGSGFAKWIEDNWENLKKNPKLQPRKPATAPELPAAADEGANATPSKPSERPTGQKDEAATEDTAQQKPKRKNRQPSKTNKNIDHSRTTVNPDGSTTYYDLQGRPVTYSVDGYPDFSPYAEAEVKVENLQGTIPPDDKLANQAVGLQSTPDGYTWHHVEDGETMQLIPSDIHAEFPHTGGASLIRSQN